MTQLVGQDAPQGAAHLPSIQARRHGGIPLATRDAGHLVGPKNDPPAWEHREREAMVVSIPTATGDPGAHRLGADHNRGGQTGIGGFRPHHLQTNAQRREDVFHFPHQRFQGLLRKRGLDPKVEREV